MKKQYVIITSKTLENQRKWLIERLENLEILQKMEAQKRQVFKDKTSQEKEIRLVKAMISQIWDLAIINKWTKTIEVEVE